MESSRRRTKTKNFVIKAKLDFNINHMSHSTSPDRSMSSLQSSQCMIFVLAFFPLPTSNLSRKEEQSSGTSWSSTLIVSCWSLVTRAQDSWLINTKHTTKLVQAIFGKTLFRVRSFLQVQKQVTSVQLEISSTTETVRRLQCRRQMRLARRTDRIERHADYFVARASTLKLYSSLEFIVLRGKLFN